MSRRFKVPRTFPRPVCVVAHSVAQVIPTGVETSVLWDTEVLDPYGMHSTVTNTSRITPTIPGWYLIESTTIWISGGTTGGRISYLKKNGTQYLAVSANVASSQLIATGFATIVDFNGSTDYVEHRVNQNQGADQSIGIAYVAGTEQRHHMAAYWLGPL